MERESSETHDAGEAWEVPCPRCRYDTRGLPVERCPECGITVEEGAAILRERQRRSMRVVNLTVSIMCGILLGAAAVSTLKLAHRVGFLGSGDRRETVLILILCGAGVSIAVLNAVRFLRRKPLLPLVLIAVVAVITFGFVIPGATLFVRF